MFLGIISFVGLSVGTIVEACEAMAAGALAASTLVDIIKGND